MAKTKIEKLDPCLPRPQDYTTPAELKVWAQRMRAERGEAGHPSTAQESATDEKD